MPSVKPHTRHPSGGLRKRFFAWVLARGNTRYEKKLERRKRLLFQSLTCTVLERGPGPHVAGVAPKKKALEK